MILGLSGHLGDRVSALVDGQLSPVEEERAWNHAMTCPGCRRLIEKEGWLKTRLSTLSAPAPGPHPAEQVRPQLLGALYDVDAWAAVDELDHRDRPRRMVALTAAGVGSLGAAVFGIVALTSAPAGMGETPNRQSPASLTRATNGPQLGPTRGESRFAGVAQMPTWLRGQTN